MVTITKHIFINIFQIECFLAVKFAMAYDKNMSFLVIPKSPKVWKKEVKGIFCDSNNIFLWHKSEDINKKRLFPEFQLILILRS